MQVVRSQPFEVGEKVDESSEEPIAQHVPKQWAHIGPRGPWAYVVHLKMAPMSPSGSLRCLAACCCWYIFMINIRTTLKPSTKMLCSSFCLTFGWPGAFCLSLWGSCFHVFVDARVSVV
jgi:hypothetical protein